MKQLTIKLTFGFLLIVFAFGCKKDHFVVDEESEESSIALRAGCIEGTISLPGGLTRFELGDPEVQAILGDLSSVRFKSTPLAMPYAYLIVDENGTIIEVSQSNILDLKKLPFGTFRIWAFSYLGNITAEPGMDLFLLGPEEGVAELAEYCYQLTSNYIEVINLAPGSTRKELLKKYAPLLKFDGGENWFPSSVEWTFDAYNLPYSQGGRLKRHPYGGKWWLISDYVEDHCSATGSWGWVNLDYFKGDLETAKVYAYFVTRPQSGDVYVDLVYFVYYPFNEGKSVFGTRLRRHVGDWENLVVRLRLSDNELKPIWVDYPAHYWDRLVGWDKVEKHLDTHPVVYVAYGSHGHHPKAGTCKYPVPAPPDISWWLLQEESNGNGPRFSTWEHLEYYDFNFKEGLEGQKWPLWMSNQYEYPGIGNADPRSGPIFRWGNTETAHSARLEDGPTGPIDKAALNDPAFPANSKVGCFCVEFPWFPTVENY